jgi:hypothetical protein
MNTATSGKPTETPYCVRTLSYQSDLHNGDFLANSQRIIRARVQAQYRFSFSDVTETMRHSLKLRASFSEWGGNGVLVIG